MSQNMLGVIHTKSAYGKGLKIGITNKNTITPAEVDFLYNNAFNYLQQEEQKFYNQFFPDKKITTIAEFTAEIRNLLEESKEDIKQLSKFCNKNLSQYLPEPEASIYDKNYILSLKGVQEEIDLKSYGFDKNFTIEVKPENLFEVKSILKEVFGRNFDPYSSNTRELRKFIENNKLGQKLFTTDISLETGSRKAALVQEFDITEVSKPQFSKKQRQKYLKNPNIDNKQLKKDMQESLDKMKAFLFGSATGDLKIAINDTWNEIFFEKKSILEKDFFFEGKNYLKALLGQGGEFYNEVIIRYIGLKTKNPILAKIIGSTLTGGQEPHSDLQIMLYCGAKINFQTKNINEQNEVDVNTNALLIEKNFGEDFTSALVNTYANTDLYDAALIKVAEEVLQKRFFEAMNLNIREDLDPSQINTFYFVGGNKIVPGSEIIQDLRERNAKGRKATFTISGSNVPSYSDKEYKTEFEKFFYWKYPEGIDAKSTSDMEPTSANYAAFQKDALSISISSSFSFTSLFKQKGRFELFNMVGL